MVDLLEYNVEFYLKTAGCFVISDEFNQMVIAHMCNTDVDVNAIDVNGPDLHIKYLQGDISILIGMSQSIRNFVFERQHDEGNYRIYSYDRIKKLIEIQALYLRNKEPNNEPDLPRNA